MLPYDLSLDELNAPDTAPSQLDLPRVTAFNGLELADVGVERRRVCEAREGVEHLGDAIICKHRYFVDVFEVTIAFAFEAGPEIGDEDLSPLV